MKKLYSLLTAGAFLLSVSTQLSAQCANGRYHNMIFPGTPIVTSNIKYGANLDQNNVMQDLFLDVYQPACDTVSKRPLIVFAHGGGFTTGNKTDAGYVALVTQYVKLGYVVATINYRLGFPLSQTDPASQYGFNSAIMRGVHDARAAVRFMRNNALNGGNTYKIDQTKIFFSGVSAGAIMALHLAYQDQASECNMACNNQPGAEGTSVEGTSNNLTVSSKVTAIISVAGGIRDLTWIKTNDVPVCLAHGTVDGTVPYGNGCFGIPSPCIFPVSGSSTIAPKCASTGTTYCFKPLIGQNHTITSVQYLDTVFTIQRNFLEKFVCGVTLNCNYTTTPAVGTCPFATGIEEETVLSNENIDVFPNPSQSDVTLKLKNVQGNHFTATLTDVAGREVGKYSFSEKEFVIKRGNMQSGIYFLKVTSDAKESFVTKLVLTSH